jgi:hypothetical protein
MTACSVIALLYSICNRSSTAFLLWATRSNGARADCDVDTMMLEYMTALMQQSRSYTYSQNTRSLSISSLKSREAEVADGIVLPRLIVPLIIEEIFEAEPSKATGNTKHGSSGLEGKGRAEELAAEVLLLHPIGDNQISAATTQAHEQILRRELDLHDESAFASARSASAATVSGVVNTILGHCVVDETQGGRQVFTGQQDKWGRYDAAAEHVLARFHTTDSQPACSRQGRTANRNVSRRVTTPTSLGANEGGGAPSLVSLQLGPPTRLPTITPG